MAVNVVHTCDSDKETFIKQKQDSVIHLHIKKNFSHSGGWRRGEEWGRGAEKKIDQKTAAPSVEFYVQVLDLSI